MLRTRLLAVLVAATAVLGTVGCEEGGAPAKLTHTREEVAATPPAQFAGQQVVANYLARIDPQNGSWKVYPLHEGKYIYDDEANLQPVVKPDGTMEPPAIAVNYNYGGTLPQNNSCTPFVDCPDSTVHMFTDQNLVTYVEDNNGITDNDGNPADDSCVRNGVSFPNDPSCGGLYPVGHPCRENGTFCAPMQAIVSNSSVVGTFPNPVLDLKDLTGTVRGCVDDSSNTTGLCASDNPLKVDSSLGATNFVPQLPGTGGTKACAYCYGNRSKAVAAGVPGLQDVLFPSKTAQSTNINTDLVVLRFCTNNANCNRGGDVQFTMRYALPALNGPGTHLATLNSNGGSCYDPAFPTRVTVNGGSFGAPGGCYVSATTNPATCNTGTSPTSGCCQVGPASTAFSQRLTVIGPGANGVTRPDEWSDVSVRSNVLPSGVYGCGVVLQTRLGTLTTTDDISVCGDTWRSWTPLVDSDINNRVTRRHAMGGVLGSDAIIVGGRTAATNAGLSSAFSMPLPRCSNSIPTTSVNNVASLPIPVWGAGYAVAQNKLWVVGGADSGTTCSNRVFSLAGVGASWVEKAPLPVPLCQATAVKLFDSDHPTKEYLVVVGGLLNAPVPFSTTPAVAPALNTATYVYDITANTWSTQTAVGSVLSTPRFNAGGTTITSTGLTALVVGGSNTTVPSGLGLKNTDSLVMHSTVITVSSRPNLPTGVVLPGVTSMGNRFYAIGGSTNNGASAPGVATTYQMAQNFAGGWVTKKAVPRVRAYGVLLRSFFDEATANDLERVIFITGSSGTSNLTIADEYEDTTTGL